MTPWCLSDHAQLEYDEQGYAICKRCGEVVRRPDPVEDMARMGIKLLEDSGVDAPLELYGYLPDPPVYE